MWVSSWEELNFPLKVSKKESHDYHINKYLLSITNENHPKLPQNMRLAGKRQENNWAPMILYWRNGREKAWKLAESSVWLPDTWCYASVMNTFVISNSKGRAGSAWRKHEVLWNCSGLASTLGTQVGHMVGLRVGSHDTSRNRLLVCNQMVLIFIQIMEEKKFSVPLQKLIHCTKGSLGWSAEMLQSFWSSYTIETHSLLTP